MKPPRLPWYRKWLSGCKIRPWRPLAICIVLDFRANLELDLSPFPDAHLFHLPLSRYGRLGSNLPDSCVRPAEIRATPHRGRPDVWSSAIMNEGCNRRAVPGSVDYLQREEAAIVITEFEFTDSPSSRQTFTSRYRRFNLGDRPTEVATLGFCQ